MKARLLFAFCFSMVTLQFIQAQPVITWQKSLGGSDHEDIRRIIQCSDKGYLVLGSSISTDGQVTGNHGAYDFWVVKVDTVGTIVWQKSYGGTGNEWLFDGLQTNEGGYILAGETDSDDGDVSGNHGGQDFWVVKIDTSGNIEWQKCLGGSLDEWAYAVQQTFDHGFVVAGNAQSSDKQVIGNHGGQDFWVVKLDPSGNLLWQSALGGSGDDYAWDIKVTSGTGYIVCGYTGSNDGQVIGNHGGKDIWVVKLADSSLQMQTCFGGSSDDLGYSIIKTSGGGFIITGYTTSTDGQVTGNHGAADLWVVKTDSNANLEWQKCLGGSGDEKGYSIRQKPECDYLVTGWTTSNNGQVTGNHGGYDIWVVRLDVSGNILWQGCLGGIAEDYGLSLQLTPEGGYVVGATSNSTAGQVTGNHGGYDYWIAKLADSVTVSGSITDSLGNPINGGKVYLLNSQNSYGGYDTAAVAIITNGAFTFCAPANNGSTILAGPDSIGLQTMLPTYLGNTILWTEADTLVASSCLDAGAIHFVPRPPVHNGHATIKGKVIKNMSKANDPIDNVGIVLKRNGKSVLWDYTNTNSNGLFTISNVEVGNYSIIMDYPGIRMYTENGANDFSVVNANDTTISLLAKVDTAYIKLYPYVGIEDLSSDDTYINIFPNPSSGKFTLSIKNANWNDATIQISDLQGRIVYSDNLVRVHAPGFTKTIGLSPISGGLYFVRIVSKKFTKVLMLMIES